MARKGYKHLNLGTKRLYNPNEFVDNNNVKWENVILWEVLEIGEHRKIKLTFVSTNSKNLQGIRFAFDAGGGYMEIEGKKYPQLYIFEDVGLGKPVYIDCYSKTGLLSMYNIFDRGPGTDAIPGGIRSQTGCCGMILKKYNNILEYHCNCTGLKTDFNELIFTIEFVE